MIADEHDDPVRAAYDAGYRDARRRYEREMDMLHGEIKGLRMMNNDILKHMSTLLSRLPIPPIRIPEDQMTAVQAKLGGDQNVD